MSLHTLRARSTVLVWSLLILSAGIACGNDASTDSTTGTPTRSTNPPAVDLEAFRKLARESDCADVTNRLFLIDNRLVFWDRDSKCADAAYARVLYDRTVDQVLCELHDSIAGPRRECHDSGPAAGMFDTMLEHLDAPDLGLGSAHTVTPVTF